MSRLLLWPAGRSFTRAHSHEFGSTEFDARADVDARFSPLYIAGELTPVLYAGADDLTAAAETIFRRLPDRGRPRRVWLDRYRAWHWSQVHARRDLRLLPLDARLAGADRLVDGDPATYPSARTEATRLLRVHPEADGFMWLSRQLHDHPSAASIEVDLAGVCLLLVGATRGRRAGVGRHDLTATHPVVPFASSAGLERLDAIAEQLDVTVVRT